MDGPGCKTIRNIEAMEEIQKVPGIIGMNIICEREQESLGVSSQKKMAVCIFAVTIEVGTKSHTCTPTHPYE